MIDVTHLKRRPLGPGDEVDTACSKCGLELAHIVVAMEAGRIVRVQCKTCKTVHAFHRSAGDARSPRKAAPKQGGHRGGAIGQSAYDQVMKGRDLSRARTYKPALRYEVNDVVSHPTFGVGVVTKLLADDKLEAAFPVGLKVLVHGRG
jgi:hypothetical protein